MSARAQGSHVLVANHALVLRWPRAFPVPDVLVLDVDMPGLASFEAARRIHEEAPHVRILFLSAYSNDHYIEEALKAEGIYG